MIIAQSVDLLLQSLPPLLSKRRYIKKNVQYSACRNLIINKDLQLQKH